MSPNPFGKWTCRFISPAKGQHDFTLDLVQSHTGPVANMDLIRQDATGKMLSVKFRVHVEVCDKYVALLSKDAAHDSLGVNAMVLQVMQDYNVMDGRIIWNSLSSHDIQNGTLAWNRTIPL